MLLFVISPGCSCIRAPPHNQTSYLYWFLCKFKDYIKTLTLIDSKKKVTNGKAVQRPFFLKGNGELFCTFYFFLLFFTTPSKFDLQPIIIILSYVSVPQNAVQNVYLVVFLSIRFIEKRNTRVPFIRDSVQCSGSGCSAYSCAHKLTYAGRICNSFLPFFREYEW